MRVVDDTPAWRKAGRLVFGKSIVQRPKPRARRLTPLPPLPWRTFALAALGVLASLWALQRYYERRHLPPPPPVVREIPAPEVVPAP
jgi:hypothetical protein